MLRSFFWRVFFSQLLSLAIALGAISLLVSLAFEDMYTGLAVRQQQDRARALASGIMPALSLHPTEAQLQNVIDELGRTSNTQICISLSPVMRAKLLRQSPGTEPNLATALPDQPTGTEIITDSACGEPIMRTILPLPGRNIGYIYVRAPMEVMVSNPVRQLHRHLAFAGVVAVLLALLVALVLSRRVALPLRRTTRLAQQMAAGDFSQRLGIRGSDEVGALARSFDSLADSLQSTLTDLHQEQARLSSILDSVAEGIMAVDATGQVVMVNPQAAALLGLTQGVGTAVRDLGLPEQVATAFTNCLTHDETYALELELARPNRHLVLHVTPVEGMVSGQRGAVAVVRDVTESRRLEQMRRRFLSDASHEIRTPLTSIGGFASAIVDGTAGTEEERVRCASVIVREVERLNRLVRDLLDLSRIESGALSLQPEEVDLGELIRAAAESFETQTNELGVTMAVSVPEELPSVQADPDRLYQVMVNLLSNALRFNRQGGQVRVRAERQDGVVRVSVQDTGRGIAAAELPYIWERFYRADAARARNDGGTGLGLAIVRSIIERHGGTVSVESEEGRGSVFSFALPAI